MMAVATKLDNQLVRALHEGAEALPGDLAELRSYLRLIEALLTEKAAELEPSWQQACAAAAEITTLQTLEITVAERAIAVRAKTLAEVRAKLAIWRALAPGAQDGDMRTPRNRMILSIEADLERLSRTDRR
jgi:hypothetical protein